jgi:predicted DCC family thiol-disulfide oxidoreductase YuxK
VRTHICVANAPEKPVLLYDGECGFCRVTIRRLQSTVGDRLEYLPFQDESVHPRFPELSTARLDLAVHLVHPDGSVSAGAESIFQARALLAEHHWLLDWYDHSPRFAHASEWVYAFVARHRVAFSRLVRLGYGDHIEPPKHVLVRAVFMRWLALIYLIAFVSLWTQIAGLVGSNGIMPAQVSMWLMKQQVTAGQIGLDRYHLLPTLAWFSATDASLQFWCGAGAVLALILFLGLCPAVCVFLLWLIYLSLATVCREFLAFQMDNLLLEAGFLAIFLSPLGLRLGGPHSSIPSRAVIWLFRWLLLRLTLLAAIAKLVSTDPAWRSLRAVHYYFETQPLPTWVGWYAAQLPDWIQRSFTLGILMVELGAGLLILAPRRPRQWAAVAIIASNVFMFFVGNLGFYHLLVIGFCLLLLDDQGLRGIPAQVLRRAPALGAKMISDQDRARSRRSHRWPKQIIVPLCILGTVLPLVQYTLNLRARWPWPLPVRSLTEWIAPFRTFNSYNLFSTVATNRLEIVLEGSFDGLRWTEYRFKYKPGAPMMRPQLVAPHQPRIDCLLWVGSSRRLYRPVWFENFCFRLLQGRAEVTRLMAADAFQDKPPRFLRAIVYEYSFVDRATRKATGSWWTRVPVEEILQPTTVNTIPAGRVGAPARTPQSRRSPMPVKPLPKKNQ